MPIAALKMLTLDSSDARRDAAFWSTVLGWEVAHVQDEYAMLTGPDGVALGLGLVADHEPPGWPNEHGSKQFHLDLAVDDLDAAAADCVSAGADAPRRAARRDVACAARPERSPLLPHAGRQLGMTTQDSDAGDPVEARGDPEDDRDRGEGADEDDVPGEVDLASVAD